MAITQVGTASNSGGTGPVSLTPDGTRVADDIVVVTAYQRPGAAMSVSASGLTFTAVVTATNDATYGSMGAWWARYPDTTNPQITVAGSTTANVSMAVTAVVLRGADTSATPLTNVGSITNQAAAASFTVTGPTGVAADTVMIGVGGSLDNNAPTADWTGGSGSGSSLTVNNSSGTDNAIGMAWEWVASGTAGNFVYTETAVASDAGRTLIFGVKPQAAVAPVASFTISDNAVWVGDSVNFTDTSTNTPTEWSWNFGTNATPATSTAQNPTGVTWSTTGAKTITMTATNAGGSDAADNGTVNVYTVLVANFSANDTTVQVGSSGPVNFTDSTTGTATSWSWDFGTNAVPATSTVQSPTGVYWTTTGTKTISLTSTNAGGSDNETKTAYIDVGNVPTASFTISDDTVWTNVGVNFTDTSTGSPTSWDWYFTSGVPGTSTSQNPSGVYWTASEVYDVGLVATNAYGDSAEFVDQVTVYNPVTADFSADDTTVGTGVDVTFTDASSASATTWSWDFGTDATPATASTEGPHVVTYSSTGNKTVSLTAGNAGGTDNETKTGYITVSAAATTVQVSSVMLVVPISSITIQRTPVGTYYNNFEGGTDTSTITTGNATSGNAWTAVSGSPKWSSTSPKSGSLGIKITESITGTQYVGWSGSPLNTSQKIAFQFWWKYPGAPTIENRLCALKNAGGNNVGGILIETNHTVRLMQLTSGLAAFQSPAMTIGNWYLFDVFIDGAYTGSTGATLKMYNEDLSVFHRYSGAFAGPSANTNVNEFIWGRPLTTTYGLDHYGDDIRVLNNATGVMTETLSPVVLTPTLTATKQNVGWEIYNGTSWRNDFEIWNGTSWRTDAEIWNGTSWIPHA